MTDIVERLRDRETRNEFDDWGIMNEAADEIERLRRTVAASYRIGEIIGFLGDDEARIEAFRAALCPKLIADLRAALEGKK